MIQNPYVSYHIDPRAFRESGIQNKLDDPIEVTPPKEDADSVLKRLCTAFTSPRKPTKVESEEMKTMIDSRVVEVNYCALILAILSKCTPETAFEKIQSSAPKKVRPQLTPEDIQDMRRFRAEGLFYHEIASYYGATKDVVYGKLNPRVYRQKGSCEPKVMQMRAGG